MSRATKFYVSAYNRDAVFTTNLYANESRELVTDFNALIQPGETITRAAWDTFDTIFAAMADPEIDGTSVKIRISAQWGGRSRIRLGVTTSTGNTYSAWHSILVKSAPYFNNQGWVTGPQHLEVIAAIPGATTILVLDSQLDVEDPARFWPIPDEFVIGPSFTVTSGGQAVVFTQTGLLYEASGVQISGVGTMTQGAYTWPCNITYSIS